MRIHFICDCGFSFYALQPDSTLINSDIKCPKCGAQQYIKNVLGYIFAKKRRYED